MSTSSRTETSETPLLGIVLGWAPVIPFVFSAAATWAMRDVTLAVRLTIIWGGAILAFLAGVRRGLSFRTPGGPDARQILTMLGLFLLALAALASPWPLAEIDQIAGQERA